MTWTTEKPTVKGWYWHTTDKTEPRIVHVIQHQQLLQADGVYLWAGYWAGQWAGPLLPPEEAK